MAQTDKIVKAVMASIVGAGVAVASSANAANVTLQACYGVAKKGAKISKPVTSRKLNMQKCYGVVKAGKNDCGSPANACSGQAKVSGNPQQWLFLLKGNCALLASGSTSPHAGKPLTAAARIKATAASTPVYVYKGNCAKLVGGSLTKPDAKTGVNKKSGALF